MKIALVSTLALLAASPLVAAQTKNDGCILCLQKALMALPACTKIPLGGISLIPSGTITPEHAACLCSSLDAAWVDSCNDGSKCDSEVSLLKANFSQLIQEFGLNCKSTPTFSPPPFTTTMETTPTAVPTEAATSTSTTVTTSTAVPTGTNPGGNNGTNTGNNTGTGTDGKNGTNGEGSKGSSSGNKAVPSLLLTQVLGAVVVLAGISASIF